MRAARISSLIGFVALSLAYHASSEAADRCGAAEAEIARLKSWADLAAWHGRFGRCDDGCVAESLDRRVVEMLAKEWETVRQLQELLEEQPRLKRFVFRHIDGESDPPQLRKVRIKARKSCPDGLNDLCREIGAAATRALAMQAQAEASARK